MTDLHEGDVLGDRFELIGVLGRGGMATVWLARDRVRDGNVALKVLHAHLAGDPSMRVRLQREVHAAALLRHEAALVAHDLHEVDGRLVLSMPFHPGQTLAERVRSGGPLDADELRTLGLRIAGVLGEAHRKGLLHRDVTPNNVMMGAQGPMLSDFGLARLQGGSASTVAMGTPGYAAPEAYLGTAADHRADLYGLGAVLHFAATGRAPSREGESVRALRPDLPGDIVDTVVALLHPRPDGRPSTASAVTEALSGGAPAVEAVAETWVAPPAAPAVRREVVLDRGEWTVLLAKQSRRRDPKLLADSVAQAVGLRPGAIVPSETLTKIIRTEVKLVSGVGREVADAVAELAETAGAKARVVKATTSPAAEVVAGYWWLPLPVMWVAFAFSASAGLNPELILPFCIMVSVVLGVTGPAFARRFGGSKAPLAFARDLSAHLAPDAVLPALVPEDPPPVAAPPSLADRARGALDQLEATIAGIPDLADVVRADLLSTANGMRSEVDALDAERALLAAEVGGSVSDFGWARGRLARLETLERAGESVASDEVASLRRAVAEGDAAVLAREAVDGRLTAVRANLLEVAAVASRARHELLAHPGPEPSRRLVQRLGRDVEAARAARRELAARGAKNAG